MRLGSAVRILVERQLTTPVGDVGGSQPDTDHTAADARSTVTPSLIEPGSELPAHPLGQGHLVEGVGIAPRPDTYLPVRRLCFDDHAVRRRPAQRRIGQQPVGEGTSHESSLLQVLQRRIEAFLHGEIGRHRARHRASVLTLRQPVRLEAVVTKSRQHRLSRQIRQRSQCRDPEPAERRRQLVLPERCHIESAQELGIIGHVEDGIVSRGHLGRTLRRKRPGREPDPVAGAGDGVDLLDDPVEQRCLIPVEPHRTGHRHQQQPGSAHLDSGNQAFDGDHHRLERNRLRSGIGLEGRHGRTARLGLATPHAGNDPGGGRGGVDGHDSAVFPYRLRRIILRRVRPAQRPVRKPNAERAFHRPPPR